MLDAKVRCSKNKQLFQAVPEHLTLDVLFLNAHTRNFLPTFAANHFILR